MLKAGKTKLAVISLIILAVIATSVFAVGVFAATHTSTVDITPHIVPNASSVAFNADVKWTSGDSIHEFRVYEPLEFSSLVCDNDPDSEWYDPFYAYTTIESIEYRYCQWNARTGNELKSENPQKNFTFSLNTAKTESCRDLFVETRDDQGIYVFHNPQVCVDTSAPETTKSFIGPYKIDPQTGVEWIDGITLVNLTAIDPEPHPAGVVETWYRNKWFEEFAQEHKLSLGPEEPCLDVNVCKNLAEYADHIEFELYSGPFPKEGESCHVLWYYSIDGVGNVENVETNCFFVDKTPPIVEKVVGSPKVEELDLELGGNGKAAWTLSESSVGDMSTKLMIPKSPTVDDFAGVDSFFDVFIQLDAITDIGFDRKVSDVGNKAWIPMVVLGIDADGDGTYEAQPLEWEASGFNPDLLGDDSFIQCEHPTGQIMSKDVNFVTEDAYNDFKCYTPNSGGNGWTAYEPLSYYKSNDVGRVETDDDVTMIKVMLNIPAADGEVVYIDNVILNSVVVIDEIDGLTWVNSSTDITFTCEDQLPHPSGDEELCFKVSYDEPQYPTYITEQYCGDDLEEGYCCVPIDASVNNQFTFNFNEGEDSFHDLEYFCRDAVEKKSETFLQYYKVDDTPPTISKRMIGNDHLGYRDDTLNELACPPNPDENDECYVADDGQNGVRIDVIDPDPTGMGCNVDEVTCTYELWWEDNPTGGPLHSGSFGEEGVDIIFTEDSTHTLKIWCEDALGNEVYDEEVFLVDSTDPETTKTYGPEGTYYIDGDIKYIDTATLITLTAKDNKVGPKDIYYKITGSVGNVPCESIEICNEYPTGNSHEDQDWNVYQNPFNGMEESCHIIEYWSEDLLGNKEDIKRQCMFVDKKAPDIDKSYIGSQSPAQIDSNTPYPHYINSQTEVEVTATDPLPHPSGVGKVEYRVTLLGTNHACLEDVVCQGETGTGNWNTYSNPFIIPDDSCHLIEIKATDNVGKSSTHQQCVFVDNKAPEIEIEVIGPQFEDYIDGITVIEVTATDQEPHPVDDVQCEWRYILDGDKPTEWYNTFPISFPEETKHDLQIKCWDALGNGLDDQYWDYETFYVDKTPPKTVKRYSGPQYSDGLVNYEESFSVDIEGSDYNLEVTVEDDGDWMVWTFDFPVEQFTGDGNLNLGLIIATDGEGNGPSYQIHNNDGADSGHGWGTWLYSPWGPTIGDGWNGWHSGDTNTPVTSLSWVEATGDRKGEGTDGILQVKILKSELGNNFHWAASPTVGSGFYAPVYDVTMQIPTAFGWATPIVDMTVPNYIYAGSEYPKWITSDTLIHLTPVDEGIHKSGIKATYWRNTLVNDENCWDQEICQSAEGSEEWNPYEEPFRKGEESCHLIEYYSVDNVDKTEDVKKQCVFVDNTPPEPYKTVDEPATEWHPVDVETDPFDPDATHFYPWIVDKCWSEDPEEMIECWKVTLDTPITLDCIDPEPHPVDNEITCFNVELDGEDATREYCRNVGGIMEDNGYCCGMNAPYEFHFREESEHNLKYYCEDALGNSNEDDVDEEKFKVLGKMFKIRINDKWNLISVPFVLLNDDPAEVFEDVESLQTVWSYDGETGKWSVYREGENHTNNLEHIEPGLGYWVLADCPGEGPRDDRCERLVVGGSLYSPGPVTPSSRTLVEGWNLIGYYGTEGRHRYGGPDPMMPYMRESKEAYCALYSLRNLDGGLLKPTNWNALVGYWEPDNPRQWEEYGLCGELDPGAGYWIAMDAEDTYNRETVCDQSMLQDLYCSIF